MVTLGLLTSALGLYSIIFSLESILKINTPNLLNIIIDSLTECYSCDPDYKYVTAPELIKSKGYCVEVHHVENKEGYVLELHRISCDRNGNKPYRNRPILMHHGLLSSSIDFVYNYPSSSLGYLSADDGYDVWLCNVRGNYYSQKNKRISKANPNFWSFTFDDVMSNDVPSIIDYILKITGKGQIHYAGFSMGTTIGLGALSENSTLRKKVTGMFLMGPVTNVSDARGLIGLLPPPVPYWLVQKTDLLPKTILNEIWAPGFCLGIPKLALDVLFDILTGDSFGTLNRTRYATLAMQMPAGSSIMLLNQFLQFRAARRFQMYDYGELENYKRYNQYTPPEYNITKITCPVRLYNAANDFLSGPKESVDICNRLPNCVRTTVGTPANGHLSLIYDPDRQMLNDIRYNIGILDAM